MRSGRAFVAFVACATALVVAPPAFGQNGELQEARARADAAAAALNEAETRAAELETEIAGQQQRLAEAEARLGELRATMRSVAVDAYIQQAGSNDVLLSVGADPNHRVRAEALTRLVQSGTADAVDEYRVLAEDASVARAGLDAALAEQRTVVDGLAARRADMARELARLEELERARIEAERRAAAAAAAAAAARQSQATGGRGNSGGGGGGSAPRSDPPPVLVGNGGFLCPVQGPVSFIDSWGYARSGGRRHQGVDMMASRGTPTVAPVAGRVEHRGNSVGGLSWHLYGDDGNRYYGTHLSGYENQGAGHVAAGTVIGYVGDTGNARGTPHLHFEIHPGGGAAVNPYPTVRAAC